MLTPLTKQVLTYQRMCHTNSAQSKLLYTKIVDTCRIIFYSYPVKVKILDIEEAIEFLFMMEGRLRNLIVNFVFEKISFDSYMKKVAFMQANLFVRAKAKKKRKEQALYSSFDELDEEKVSEESSLYLPEKHQDILSDSLEWNCESPLTQELKNRIVKSQVFKQRFIQLVLLCSEELTAQHITFLSQFLEIKESTLANLLCKVHQLSEKKRQKRDSMREIRNGHFYYRQFLERELYILNQMRADPILIERCLKKLLRVREFFTKSVTEVRERPNSITHTVIATAVEMPKGTIDSGLHTIKKTLDQLMDAYG